MEQEGLKVNLHQLLRAMIEKGASDMHITTGSPPLLRIDGAIVPLKLPPLSPVETKQLCYSVLTEEQKIAFEKAKELDLSFGVKSLSRFRANIFMQRGAVSGAFRSIPFKILTFDELGLPPAVAALASRPRGLVLVTGPTGSGKSTTLASIVDKINGETRQHIMTVEDPIEYLHPHKRCIVNQREVGSDTQGFKQALKYVLRQDPDVVLVGEMRDLETIEAALTIAETGHLVFATLHTNSAIQSITRIIDVFPPHQQSQIRAQLSFVLEGVLSQLLIPRAGGPGRALAMEVLIPTPAVRNLIREDKIHQIYSQMQVGQGQHGMQTMNQSLYSLYARRLISLEEAMGRSSDQDELRTMIEGKAPGAEAVRQGR
jgi:twitching motility protein PilT